MNVCFRYIYTIEAPGAVLFNHFYAFGFKVAHILQNYIFILLSSRPKFLDISNFEYVSVLVLSLRAPCTVHVSRWGGVRLEGS